MRALVLLVSLVPLVAQISSPGRPISAAQIAAWRSRIRSTLFANPPPPTLKPEFHGRFEPEPDVIAERVTFGTQFGMKVPAILYLPKKRQGRVPALVVVNGHGGDKYSWYAFYSGILYARAGAVVLTFDPAGEGERNRIASRVPGRMIWNGKAHSGPDRSLLPSCLPAV